MNIQDDATPSNSLCISSIQVCVHLPPAILQKLTQWSVDTLEKTWGWVSAVLDVAEGQLQRGNQFDTEVTKYTILSLMFSK